MKWLPIKLVIFNREIGLDKPNTAKLAQEKE